MKALPGALIAAVILLTGLSCSGSPEEGRVFVLLYHSFLGCGRYPTDVSLDELRTHLEFFKKKRYSFIGFADMTQGIVTGTKNILVTVGDGNAGFYRAHSVVFRPLGIKPLVAVYSHVIGRSNCTLTWKQLREMADNGCEIACHGYYHHRVDDKLF